MKYLLSVFFLVPLVAQQTPRNVLPRLQQYLELSTAQVYAFIANADEYNRKVAERQPRLRQVQQEILEETLKADLDANALGVRYLEIELICREIKESALALRSQNIELLSEAQKTKLKTLEAALPMLPLLAESQSANLTGSWISPPAGFNPIGTVSTMPLQFFGVSGPIQGCVGTGVLTPR